jgi:hypothetical protein
VPKIGLISTAATLPLFIVDAPFNTNKDNAKVVNKNLDKFKTSNSLLDTIFSSTEKLDISIIFVECVPPIINTDFPTREQLIQSIITYNPKFIDLY